LDGFYGNQSTFIYSILDWNGSPGFAAIACVVGILACALGHLVFGWGIFRLRVYLVDRSRTES